MAQLQQKRQSNVIHSETFIYKEAFLFYFYSDKDSYQKDYKLS